MPRTLREHIVDIIIASGHELPHVGEVTHEDEILKLLLDELQPFDIAYLLAELPEQFQLELLAILSDEVAAAALEHLDYDLQYQLLDDLHTEHAKAILSEMPMHHLADLVNSLHPLRSQVLLERIPEEQKPHLDEVQTLAPDTAGRRMSVRYFQAREDWTAARTIAHFRKVGHQVDIANYIYVVDRKGRPVGVASMRDVLLSDDRATLSDIMYTKIVTVEATATQELAAQLLKQYDFVALPVVNEKGRLVGVISVDDILDVMQEEATEDIQLLGGSKPLEESYLSTKFSSLFRSRVGWLLVLFVAESFTGTIMRHFENVLDQVVALAFFIPLLIGTGGNSGSQASTMVTRAVALGELDLKHFFGVVWREARVSLALGAVMAVAAFARATMLGESAMLGVTVAISVWLIVIVGSTVGAALPLIGKRLGLDPAVFSAPLITTVADGVGLIIYFKVAVWLLNL